MSRFNGPLSPHACSSLQINQELQAAHVYLSLSSWAGHVNQALPGLEKFFRESAEEEREHAQKLINYQNRRGGKVVLETLQAPDPDWSSARNAIESTLQLEKGRFIVFILKLDIERGTIKNRPSRCQSAQGQETPQMLTYCSLHF